jgi:hypothetical protein
MANTQISINKNGTTTLATEGLYCDVDIDVNANVPTYEAELLEQTAREHSLLDRTVVNYESDTATNVGVYAFRMCSSLERLKFTQKITFANMSCADTPKLAKLILTNESVSELSMVGALQNSGIAKGTGYIYVPNNLVDAYKTATNWSTYANQIKSINELGE